jgi:hypothetical protein
MPKTEDDFPLTMAQAEALFKLAVNTYQKQAHLC